MSPCPYPSTITMTPRASVKDGKKAKEEMIIRIIIILGTILRVDGRRTSKMNKRTTKLMTDYMSQERREKKDLPALKITSIHQYNDKKAT